MLGGTKCVAFSYYFHFNYASLQSLGLKVLVTHIINLNKTSCWFFINENTILKNFQRLKLSWTDLQVKNLFLLSFGLKSIIHEINIPDILHLSSFASGHAFLHIF